MPLLGETQVKPDPVVKSKKSVRKDNSQTPKFVAIPSFPRTLPGEWVVVRQEPNMEAVMRFPASSDLPPHHHPFDLHISVLVGTILLEDLTASQAYLIEAGQQYSIPATHVHEIQCLTETYLHCSFEAGEFVVYWDLGER